MGDIKHEKIVYSEIGQMVDRYWSEIPDHFENVTNDQYIVMPDHLHGILHIGNKWIRRGTACRAFTHRKWQVRSHRIADHVLHLIPDTSRPMYHP